MANDPGKENPEELPVLCPSRWAAPGGRGSPPKRLAGVNGQVEAKYREAREGMQKMLTEGLGGGAAPATSLASLTTTTTKIQLTDEAPELK